MRKSLLLAALALPLLMAAKDPQLQITPQPLPEGVSSVSPAQGFIDVSNDEYASPKGCGAIGIKFGGKQVAINKNCKTPAKLYKDNFETPVEESFIRAIEPMVHLEGSVLFKKGAYNTTGIYKVEIPDGFFVYADGTYDKDGDETGTVPTPGMTLYYEIYVGYNVSPAPGVVPELEVVMLNFPDADEVQINSVASVPGLSGDLLFYEENGSYFSISPTVMGKNQVALSFGSDGISQTFINPGEFTIAIAAGKFSWKTYGPDYATDPTDFVEHKSPYMIIKYTIPHFPQPAIYPDTFEPVQSFEFFELTMPENLTKWINNDKVVSYIYPVSDNGVLNTAAPLMACLIDIDDPDCLVPDPSNPGQTIYDPNAVILYLYDIFTNENVPVADWKRLEKWSPADGQYCLRLGKDLFSGMYKSMLTDQDSFVNCPAFDYYYTVSGNGTGVKDVEEIAGEDGLTIYTITGLLVAKNAPAEAFNALAPGLYIVNGKKLLKK